VGKTAKKQFNKDEEVCGNCAFFDEFPIQKSAENLLGSCKANPPVPAPDYSESKLGIWPLVLGSFWCGIFSKKEGEEKK
jgi:hypothetical protein